MAETRFTPGPWTIDRDHAFAGRDVRREIANGFNVSAEGWHGLAAVFTAGSDPTDPEGRANTHLIAAAPEMYEALEMVVTHYSASLDYRPPYVAAALKALTSARGGTDA